MAITHATTMRNTLADAVDTAVNTGATDSYGDFVVMDDPSDIISFTLQNPAFGAASSGTITLLGVPLSATASGTGTADKFEVRDRNNAMVYTGTVTGTGGGGDVEIDNTSVTSGQSAELSSHTYSAPA